MEHIYLPGRCCKIVMVLENSLRNAKEFMQLDYIVKFV